MRPTLGFQFRLGTGAIDSAAAAATGSRRGYLFTFRKCLQCIPFTPVLCCLCPLKIEKEDKCCLEFSEFSRTLFLQDLGLG